MPEKIQIKQKSTGKTYTIEKPDGWSDEQTTQWFQKEYLPAQKPAVVGSQPTGSEMGLRNAGRAFAQGGTFGFQDELQAGLGTAMDVLGGNIPLKEAPDQYRMLRDVERRDQNAFAQENPKANFALQVAGGLPTAAIGGGANALRAGWTGMAQQGAKFGAVAGLGTSEAELTQPGLGTLGQAAMDTGIGAGLGAGIGVAAPWALQQGAAGVRQFGRGVGQVVNAVTPQPVRQRVQQSLGRLGVREYLGRVNRATRGGQSPDVGPEHQRLIDRARELNLQVTPGVRLNDRQLRDMEAMHRSNPFSPVGATLWNVQRGNAHELNRASAQRLGLVTESGEFSATMLGVARSNLSRGFNSVRAQIPRFKFDQQSRLQMNRLMTEATDPALPNKGVAAELRRLQSVDDFNGYVSGERAMELRKKWSEAAREAWLPGKQNDTGKARMYEGLVEMLDDRIERVAGPDLLPTWQQYRSMWRDLIVLDSPGVVTKNSVNPQALNQALGRVYRTRYRNNMDIDPVNGRGDDWFDMTRALTNASDMIGDSGTATRLAYMSQGSGYSPSLMMGLAASRVTAPIFGGAYMRGGHSMAMPPGVLARGAGRAARPVTAPLLDEGKRYLDEEIK